MRWERPVPMQLWQLDVTASAFLADGTEVKVVTGIDDHSRYCVIARAVRAVGQGGQAASPVTAHPGVHALPGHAMTGSNFGDRAPGLYFQHSAIPLFHDTQLHQHRPGLPRDRK